MTDTITCDMQLAGYLLATGHRLMRVDQERRRKIFVFESCDDAVHEFYNGTGIVSACALFNGYIQVKDLVFGNRS